MSALSLHGLSPQMLLHPKPWGLTGLVLLSELWGRYPACGSTSQHLHPKLLWCPISSYGTLNLPPGKPCSARVDAHVHGFSPFPHSLSYSCAPFHTVFIDTSATCSLGLVLGFVLTCLCPLLLGSGCWGALAVWLQQPCLCCSTPFSLLVHGYSLLCCFCLCPLPTAAPSCLPLVLLSGSLAVAQHWLALALGRREIFLSLPRCSPQ